MLENTPGNPQVHGFNGVDPGFSSSGVMGSEGMYANKSAGEIPHHQVFDSNGIAAGRQSLTPLDNSYLVASATYGTTNDMMSPSNQANGAQEGNSTQAANVSQSHSTAGADPNAVAQQLLTSKELCRALHSAAVAANEQTGLLVSHTELLLNQAVRAASTNSSTNDALFGLVLQSGSASVADTVARSVISLINTARRSLSSLLIRAEGGNQPTLSSIPIPESLTQLAQYDVTLSGTPPANKSEPVSFQTSAPSPLGTSATKTPGAEVGAEVYSEVGNHSTLVGRKRSPSGPPSNEGGQVPESIRTGYSKRLRTRRQQEPTPEDPWQWYKYGERPIKNTSFFRSYYRCSRRDDAGCTAKKLVDHHPQDSSLLRVFFEGSHTHAPPLPMERRRLMYHLPDLNRQLANGVRPANLQNVQNSVIHSNVPGAMGTSQVENPNPANLNGGHPTNGGGMPDPGDHAGMDNAESLSITWHNSEPMVNVTEVIPEEAKVKMQQVDAEGTGMEDSGQIIHSEIPVNSENAGDPHSNPGAGMVQGHSMNRVN